MMGKNASKQTGICVFCGTEGEVTEDHVPPKGIYPKLNTGEPLITVPACLSCNRGTSADDEFFRDIMASRVESYSHQHAGQARARMVRSLARPEAKGKRGAFERSIAATRGNRRGHISISDVAAIQLGDEELLRLHRTGRKIIRGLYWHETERILPQDVLVMAIRDDQFEAWKYTKPVDNWLENGVWRDIREGTFSYRCRVSEVDPNFSVWHLSFFSGPSVIKGGFAQGPQWLGATKTSAMTLEEAFPEVASRVA